MDAHQNSKHKHAKQRKESTITSFSERESILIIKKVVQKSRTHEYEVNKKRKKN